MYQLAERLFVDIKIDNVSLPFEAITLGHIQINSGRKFHVPMGSISISDPVGIIGRNIFLVDGAQIVIKLSNQAEHANPKSYYFRLFNSVKRTVNGAPSYSITFLADYVSYLNQSTTKTLTGTSAKVIEEIAKKCGLKYYADPTSDKQDWMPINEKYCKFVNSIASAGYINDRSCMMYGIDLNGVLKYIDYNQIKFDKDVPVFVYGRNANKGETQVWDRKFIGSSGVMNAAGGYNTTRVEQNIITGEDSKFNDVKTVRKSNRLSMGSVNKEKITRGRVNFAPVNCGNVHDNYQQAIHQNTRITNMQNVAFRIATMQMSNYELFDPVKFDLFEVSSNSLVKDTVNSGNYVIEEKTIFVTPNSLYIEGFKFIRDGFNYEKANNLT